jgi:hypothetical protein
VRSAVDSAVESEVDSEVDSLVSSAVYSAVSLEVDSAVRSAVDSAVSSAVSSAVRSAVDQFIAQCAKRPWSSYNGGNAWPWWPAFVSYFREIVGLDIDYSKWQDFEDATHYHYRYAQKHFCMVSEHPEHIKLDDAGRPHCATGPYLRYSSGFALYYWHGVQVPREWIESPATLDMQTALTWENVEQRRAAAEIIGWARILEVLPHRVIDTDADPQIGTLLEVDLPGAPASRFLRVRCGTGRDFVLPVPAEVEGRRIDTALEEARCEIPSLLRVIRALTEDPTPQSKVVDLMAALQASLEKAKADTEDPT